MVEIGAVFGQLTVIAVGGDKGGRILCRCACGKEKSCEAHRLRNGHVKSCGCLKGEQHGGANSPEYKIWGAVIERCENPRSDHFDRYGGRGIRVCERWRESFAAFLADMGPRPSPRHSIDRIDNNGNYEPGNCRWVTHTEQMRNRSNTRMLQFNGQSLPLATWAEQLGLSVAAIEGRLRRGWSVERALTAPLDAFRGGHLCAR